jgi:serine/threonine protein kinase
VGPFQVEGALLASPASRVYLARDQDRVAIALKLRDEPSSANRTRLLREARALAGLEHPGVARMMGSGEHGKWLFFASELVRGKTVREILADEGPVLPARALRWVIEVTEALEAAHGAGVVHGDLESASVVITHADRAKVVGFGGPLRRIDPTEEPEDIGHLAPEQIEHGLADERSDVWAVGCLLFELCAGTPPFGRSGRDTANAIVRNEPALPTTISGSIADLIASCLRKMSFSRISSMRELGSMLRDALENPTAPSAVTTAIERASERAARLTSRPPSAAPRNVPSSRRSSNRPLPPSHPPAPRPPAFGPRTSHPPPPIDSAHRGHVKGTAVRAALAWCADTYGAETLAQLFERASPELRAVLRPEDPVLGIIPSSWYPTRAVGEMIELLEQVTRPTDLETHWTSMAQAIAKDNVFGVYKSLFRLVTTPAALEANAQRVWHTYCDEGTLSAREVRPGELRFELRGWTFHHPQACRAVGHIAQQALRAVGYRGLVVERMQCVSEGHGLCSFEGLYLP